MIKSRVVRLPVMVLLSLLFGCVQEVGNDIRHYDCFYARVEQEGDVTRAHFEESAVKWEVNDKISVYSDIQTRPIFFTRNASGTFTNSSGISGGIFYAFYPTTGERLSSSENYVTFSIPGPAFDRNSVSIPMVARGGSNNLTFTQTCGVLHFFITGTGSYDKVTLRSNNGEYITGHGQIDLSSSSPSFSITGNGSAFISATVPSGSNWKSGVDVYFIVPPVVLTGGFTVSIENSADNVVLSKRTDKSITISRKKMIRYTVNLDELVMDDLDKQPIDLGLSVKWASFNVGATKPEEYGDYFAWGETAPKSDYSWSTYKWCNGGYNQLIKYCAHNSYWGGIDPMDNKTALDPEDDAAYVNWGDGWRMPTKKEQDELRDNCTWTWTGNYNGTGIAGTIVTSKKAGYTDKYIFLPAAGYCSEKGLNNLGSGGGYWSSSLGTAFPYYAFYLSFNSGNLGWKSHNRYYGFSVRPVCP